MDNDSSQQTPQASAQPSVPATGRRVLCIEDERFITELYVRALTKAGYRVDAVSDGKEALKAAQTNEYDIILLDLMIPSMTGIEVLQNLRDPARVPPIKSKIIITTNLEQREDVRANIETQADGYLVKAELTPSELVKFLDNIK